MTASSVEMLNIIGVENEHAWDITSKRKLKSVQPPVVSYSRKNIKFCSPRNKLSSHKKSRSLAKVNLALLWLPLSILKLAAT